MEIRRPLKRNLPKLGPPDIYPQDPRQKEDELTSINVKHGYASAPLISGPNILDEFGTAKHANVDAFGVYFSALLSEKHRINTIKDTQKKKQLVNTKEIWYVHAKTKHAVDNWFRDLSKGTKSLSQLGKRIPIFNSKEGIFSQLYESRVPFTKAVWFIKMSAVHAIALSESSSKSKKRQVPDQYQELTTALTRYLKDILFKIFECYQQTQLQQPKSTNQTENACQSLLSQLNMPKLLSQKLQSATSSTNPTTSQIIHLTQNLGSYSSISSLLNNQSQFTNNLHTSVASLVTSHTASVASIIASSAASLQIGHDEFLPTYNQWQYQTQLSRYLFDDGLLDRYDFLSFLLELMEKKRPTTDLVVRLIYPFVLEYVVDFSKSAVLSRRLAHVCARKLCQALAHISSASSDLYSNVIYILSCMMQVICIECPTAMVRHNIIDTKFPTMYQGSPLDNLPCLPSNLPMMESDLNSEFRRAVHEAEREILFRSAMSDSKWSCTSSRRAENSKSVLVNRLLMALTTLDNYNFDKIDSVNSFDILYSKLFPSDDPLLVGTSVQVSSDNAPSNTNTIDQSMTNVNTNFNQHNNHDHSKKSKHQQAVNSSRQTFAELGDLHGQSVKTYEEHIVKLLCEWATTTQRTGEHRAFVVGRLLERRQSELQLRNQEIRMSAIVSEKKTENLNTLANSQLLDSDLSENPHKESTKDDQQEDLIEYVFQDLLVQFLDQNAPVVEENHEDDIDVEKAFKNLVMLFGELIRCDVFSHYNYMCKLISRGMFNDLSISNKTQTMTDNHIDDVDADLGKILQDIKEGQQDEVADLLLPDYLGGSREETSSKNAQINKLSPFGIGERSSALDSAAPSASHIMPTNNFLSTSVDSKSIGMTPINEDRSCAKNPREHRHLVFVKHFPVPDDDNFGRDINQRNILLHGFGREREEARHIIKKLNKEICKLLSRRASRDINDGGRIKKIATRDCFNPETTLQKFDALNSHDQHIITNSLSIAILEMFTGVSNGQTSSLPTLESVSFIFDLFSMSSNVSGLLEMVVPILEELPDVEAQIKLKCPSLSSQYTNSVALCIVGLLYRYHSCVLLMNKEEICSIYESLYKLVAHVQNPGLCMTSAERVIFSYLHDLYTSYLNGKSFSQYAWLVQKIKQQLQNVTSVSQNLDMTHEWTPTFLTNIVSQLAASSLCLSSSTNPILNASSGTSTANSFGTPNAHDLTVSIRQQLYSFDSPVLRQMNEIPGARYRFVCDAIYLSATSTSTDIVNDIAVLCADLTSKCSSLMDDWIYALQALLCSAQREHSYRQILDKINITDPQVKDNIAIFVAILVARRCIQLDDFIIKCAIGAILAPLSAVDKHPTDSGVRLTCHLLLTLFRNREGTGIQSRSNQPPLYNSQSAFGQTFSNYSSNINSYNGILGSVSQIGILPSINKDPDGNSKTLLSLKYLCDHYLLRSACCNIRTECHITLLKAIRVLAISANPNNEADAQCKFKTETQFNDLSVDGMSQMSKDGLERRPGSPISLDRDLSLNQWHINLQTASLHQFADAILRLLCSQRWLHDKCLADSDIFTTLDNEKNILLDPRIDVKQSQRLLYMICYNKSPEMQADVGLDDQGSDQVASIVKMFDSLDVWSMRLSLMRLQFMFAYCKSQSNVMLNDWLDNLAKGVVEFFQKSSQDNEPFDKENDDSGDGSRKSKSNKSSIISGSAVTKINKVWLVEPLLNKLVRPPSAIQSKIIKASAALMESASVRANSLPSLNQTYLSTAAASTKFKERTLSQRGSASTNPSNLASTSLLGFEPFLSLLLACLKHQDKERETLLTSLNSQLYQAIHEKVDDIGYKQSLQDGLELRLCLIGQMFDTIQRSPNLTSDWATLLLLLIMNNLVDPQLDYGLYVTVLDMLAMLIQTAYASDPIEQKEESKKQYQNLMKKFRKELAALDEKGYMQMKLITPLMPLVRQMTEVITCEPMGSLVDTKGEKVENFYSIDKKKGLKVSELQEVSPWDLIEGHKNPAPLCWPWFGAIKMEHKPLRADENNRLMSWHTHTLRLDTSHYTQTPNIDDGPSGNKRINTEKKPSQSNPLLKSLIEANDEIHTLVRRDASSILMDEDAPMLEDQDRTDQLMSNDDLLEDYCALSVDFLFDSAPVENMIEDIKAAMQAEDAAQANRAKPIIAPIVRPISDVKPALLPQPSAQASSILAPAHPAIISEPPKPETPVSALSALQNHLNAPVTTRPEPKQKAPRKKRVSKKDTLAQQQIAASVRPKTPTQSQSIRSSDQQIQPSLPFQSMSHSTHPAASLQQTPQMQSSIQAQQHHIQQPQQHLQQQQQQQQQQQVQQIQHVQQIQPVQQVQQQHQLHYQPQGSIRHSVHGQLPQHVQVAPQIRLPDHHQQSSYQPIQIHQQHSINTHAPASQSPIGMQQPSIQNLHQQQQQQQQQQQGQQQQQHLQQHHQHHQIQYIPQQQHQHQQQQHPLQHQQQQLSQRSHQMGNHQQHIQPQAIRLGSHQQPMQFQPMQLPATHQSSQQQQQMFVPQQAAGHSRPALTAMLHQKHAAAGNLDSKLHSRT